jgi:hypothetical protein
MNPIPYYSIGLLFCCGLFFVALYSLAHSERVASIFAWVPTSIFALVPIRWTNAVIRFGARFFLVISVVGIIFYISLAILAVMGKHV